MPGVWDFYLSEGHKEVLYIQINNETDSRFVWRLFPVGETLCLENKEKRQSKNSCKDICILLLNSQPLHNEGHIYSAAQIDCSKAVLWY